MGFDLFLFFQEVFGRSPCYSKIHTHMMQVRSLAGAAGGWAFLETEAVRKRLGGAQALGNAFRV